MFLSGDVSVCVSFVVSVVFEKVVDSDVCVCVIFLLVVFGVMFRI